MKYLWERFTEFEVLGLLGGLALLWLILIYVHNSINLNSILAVYESLLVFYPR
jgi:hypothetical protein